VRTTLMMGSAIVLALAAVTVSARGQFRPPRSEQGRRYCLRGVAPSGRGDSFASGSTSTTGSTGNSLCRSGIRMGVPRFTGAGRSW